MDFTLKNNSLHLQKICHGERMTDKKNDASLVNHPLHNEWLKRVEELENEGCDTSDAQSIADLEFSNK